MNRESKVRSIVRSVKKTEAAWRYGLNLRPSVDYLLHGRAARSNAEDKIIQDLNRNGVAETRVETLLSEPDDYTRLDKNVSALIDEKRQSIENLKARADGADSIGDKTFNLEALGSELTFDPNSEFARFALNESFLRIANAYLGMRARLRYYNVWYTAASASKARESQLWHYDREDRYILKIFLYLNDVDEGSGPFTYAPGTHKKGRDRSLDPEYFTEGGVRRTNDEQMARAFPRDRWKTCTGKKGTIIFADTRGFHKGGEARTGDRLMFTCMYTSPASESKRLINFPAAFDVKSLSETQLAALDIRVPQQKNTA